MRLYVQAYRGVYALGRRTATALYVERVNLPGVAGSLEPITRIRPFP